MFLGSKRIAFVPLSTGNPYYYLSDHLGSTAVIGSGDGKAIEWEADYFPFGSERKIFTSSVSNLYQFTGYEYDSSSGYNYAVARFEAGSWGRFLSPDPYLGSMDLANPQSMNRYAYVIDSPVNFIDPNGLDCTGSQTVVVTPSGATFGQVIISGCNPSGGAGGDPGPGIPLIYRPGGQAGNKGGGQQDNSKKPQPPITEPKSEEKPGWCTALVHAGNTTVAVGGAVFLWGTLADAGVVTAPAGFISQASGAIGAAVGGIGIGIGDAGLGLGICK